MKCKNCGTEFMEGIFCPECGTKYEEASENMQNNIQQESIEPLESTINNEIHNDSIVTQNTNINQNENILNTDRNGQLDEKSDNKKDGSRSLAILALVFGIISLLSCGAFIIPEILGIVFGVMGRKSNKMQGMATAGMVLSIIASVLAVLFFIIGALL